MNWQSHLMFHFIFGLDFLFIQKAIFLLIYGRMHVNANNNLSYIPFFTLIDGSVHFNNGKENRSPYPLSLLLTTEPLTYKEKRVLSFKVYINP